MFFKKKLTWVKVFENAEGLKKRIPIGNSESFEVANKMVCIAHVPDGLFAVEDKCPHQGASLGGGKCNSDDNIVCPLHRYEFNVKTGKGRAGYIDAYPLEERSDGVFVQLNV